jgi:hypothetical protein
VGLTNGVVRVVMVPLITCGHILDINLRVVHEQVDKLDVAIVRINVNSNNRGS